MKRYLLLILLAIALPAVAADAPVISPIKAPTPTVVELQQEIATLQKQVQQAQAFIQTLIAQRNDALNSVASLQAQQAHPDLFQQPKQ